MRKGDQYVNKTTLSDRGLCYTIGMNFISVDFIDVQMSANHSQTE